MSPEDDEESVNMAHTVVMHAPVDAEMRIEIKCDSDRDIVVARVAGAAIESLPEEEDGAFDLPPAAGPLFVDCEEPGKYLGFVQILETTAEAGSQPVSLSLMLVPLPGIEYVKVSPRSA